MERINNFYEFKDYTIHVFRGLANVEDMNWDREIIFTLSKKGENIRGELILKPLWHFDGDEDNSEYKNQYEENEYFQQTFLTYPVRKNIGSILHDFIIANKNDLNIKNVFSTKTAEDNHVISIDAEAFWQKRILLNKAEHDERVDRHKIKFESI